MIDQPLKSILSSVLTELADPEKSERSALVDSWEQMVGNKIAHRTKPRFSQDGKVIVWVEDSTLAFELSQRYKPAILKRLKNKFGESRIKDIRFLVGELR